MRLRRLERAGLAKLRRDRGREREIAPASRRTRRFSSARTAGRATGPLSCRKGERRRIRGPARLGPERGRCGLARARRVDHTVRARAVPDAKPCSSVGIPRARSSPCRALTSRSPARSRRFPSVARARVATFAPLRAGGGFCLKILEALDAARPVVATGLGAEGLEDLDCAGASSFPLRRSVMEWEIINLSHDRGREAVSAAVGDLHGRLPCGRCSSMLAAGLRRSGASV